MLAAGTTNDGEVAMTRTLLLTMMTVLLGCGSYAGSMAPADPNYGPSGASWSQSTAAPANEAPTTEGEVAGQPAPAPEQALVVYQGYLKLRVRRVLAAVEAIGELTDQAKGYVDAQREQVVIVRIPAGDFEAAMATFATVGEVLDRRVRAIDVTEQFTDLGGRLEVARAARERLLLLLAQATDVEERLRIVQEVKRLTELVESMESTLATLENLVAYYTITIELVPVLDEGRPVAHVSPFPWVRRLAAHRATLSGGRDAVDMELPRGFVQFTEDEGFRAQAADTTTLRAALVDNEPLGDAAFWAAAIEHEMDGRDEEVVARDRSGILTLRSFRDAEAQPRIYQIGVAVDGDRLLVVEAFFPTEEAWRTHGAAVTAALGTLQVAP